DEFERNDGRGYARKVCKACRNEQGKASRARLRLIRESNHEICATQMCVRCKIELPAECFWWSLLKCTGLSSWCKQCQNERRREQRRATRKSEASYSDVARHFGLFKVYAGPHARPVHRDGREHFGLNVAAHRPSKGRRLRFALRPA